MSIVCIGGMDSSGGAGVTADIKTLTSLGHHPKSVITTVTAQSHSQFLTHTPLSIDTIRSQWQGIIEDGEPEVVKIGLIPNEEVLDGIIDCIKDFKGFVIFDPVLATSSHFQFNVSKEKIFTLIHHCDLITPNIPEAKILFGEHFSDFKGINIEKTAILVKGGHSDDENWSRDVLYTQNEKKTFFSPKLNKSFRGTGCSLASAIAGFFPTTRDLTEAITQAKSYINQGMTGEPPYLYHNPWPSIKNTMPRTKVFPYKFPNCGEEALGTYPVVDSKEWIESLLKLGVKTLQLRVKDKADLELEEEIKTSITLAKQYQCRLFINDYWELAIKHNAYGVHLGQEDLLDADIQAIYQAGLRLGISTHTYYEAAIANSFNPSYIALGPVFETTLKKMPYAPQGLLRLNQWSKLFDCPIVAIGGLTPERGSLCYKAGADGVAMVSDITLREHYPERLKEWQAIEPL